MSEDRRPDILVTNPLPWPRKISGTISKYATTARGDPEDETSARHWQDRNLNDDRFLLPPTDVPEFGYAVVAGEDLHRNADWPTDERCIIETNRYRITFDRDRGGIKNLYDSRLGREWVDPNADYPLAGIVHERVADKSAADSRDLLFHAPEGGDDNPGGLWNAAPEVVEPFLEPEAENIESRWGFQSEWYAERTGPSKVTRHRVTRTPLGFDVRQTLAVPGIPDEVRLHVSIPHKGDDLVICAEWEQERDTHPSATYLAFPFDIDDPTAHLDVGEQAMRPGRDQLPASNHDYYTVQRWVDLSGVKDGMTVACPLNPLVQFGDFHFGDAQREFALDRALLLGWVATNYYNTNFRPFQPGRVRARYHLHPHDGGFDESFAHRIGREAEHHAPLVHPRFERIAAEARGPAKSSLLDLPEPPILVVQVRPSTSGPADIHPTGGVSPSSVTATGVELRLMNASDKKHTARVASGVLTLAEAKEVGYLGEIGAEAADVAVVDGALEVDLMSRELTTLQLSFE